MELYIQIGEIFNCEIRGIGAKGKGVFIIYFRILNISELSETNFSTHVKSNWSLFELLNYYKRQNNKFQVEFEGFEQNNRNPKWILRIVN